MAIDYVLAMGCEPQKLLGTERLVALHRTRILARSALLHMQEDGESRPPSAIEVQLTMRKPGGDPARGVTPADLPARRPPPAEVATPCPECPAGMTREFACHRRIRYPVPEHVEQWLMARLPANLGCTAGALLVRGLGEFAWDGAPTARLRAAGTTYFESRVAHGVRWVGPDGTTELSSDQLFHMMFMVGNLAPAHSLMIALFLGVIPHDTSLHLLKGGPARDLVLEHAFVASEADGDIEQLAAFLRMLALAARLDATVLIDG